MVNFNQTVALNNESNNTNLTDYCPFTLNIEPKNLIFSKKIRAIEYIWGDGSTTLINYKPSIVSNTSLPFPTDIGNPLNYPQSHEYYSKDLNLSIYNIVIKIYFFQTNDFETFNIELNLKNPDLQSIFNSKFNEFHLIKTRMFGPDNQLLYVFQSQNPNYILMSNVKWKSLPISQVSISPLNKSYGYSLPFDSSFSSNAPINGAVKIIKYIPQIAINPDNGGNVQL
jgi:hypothetical protein